MQYYMEPQIKEIQEMANKSVEDYKCPKCNRSFGWWNGEKCSYCGWTNRIQKYTNNGLSSKQDNKKPSEVVTNKNTKPTSNKCSNDNSNNQSKPISSVKDAGGTVEYFLMCKGEKKQGPFTISQLKTVIAGLGGDIHFKIRSSETCQWTSLDKAGTVFPELVSNGVMEDISEWQNKRKVVEKNIFAQKKNAQKKNTKQSNDENEMFLFLIPAAWAVFLIILFGVIIANDKNAPNPDSTELFSYIVHTDRGSFFSGMAGPIYTVTNTLSGKNAGVILDDIWGQGNGGYKFGFVLGSILLFTGIGPIATLAALIRSQMD